VSTIACPYATATLSRYAIPLEMRHVLTPLPVATSVRFHVDDREVPAVVWMRCVACCSSVGVPVAVPED
jgi:hypothetical protein